VTKTAQFTCDPKIGHWTALKRIFRSHLVYGCSPSSLSLTAYCDADWAGDPETWRSTTGFIIMFGGSAIYWSTRQQKTIAISTTEAEYMAAAETVKEIKWIKQLLRDLGQDKISTETTIIHCDNQASIYSNR
jgi:hypothetical protein